MTFCRLGFHGPAYRSTDDAGVRIFRCGDCDKSLGPVIQREGRFVGLGPSCETTKATPRTRREQLRQIK
jgi:hypothetical protein